LLGRLTIPRLNLTEMVREGAQESTLSLALGHIPGTALPGQRGNVGVAGHRDKIFRGLRDVQKDDLIRFETLDGTYLYRVQETEIVMPDQVSVLRASQHPELTLVTCYPFYYVGSAPQRFIVKAREVSSPATIGSLTASR
jgi:sortase A